MSNLLGPQSVKRSKLAWRSYPILPWERQDIVQLSVLQILASAIRNDRPIPNAIVAVGKEQRWLIRSELEYMGTLLKNGMSLGDAVVRFMRLFDLDSAFAIQVGQRTNTLVPVLEGEIDRLKKSLSRSLFPTRPSKAYWLYYMWGAFVYVTFIVMLIVPTMKKMFDEFGISLPEPTKVFIQFSDVHSDYVGLAFLGLIALTLLLLFDRVAIGFLRHLPIRFLAYDRKRGMSNVYRVLATMLENGVSVDESIRTFASHHQDPILKMRLSTARKKMDKGLAPWLALGEAGVLPKETAISLEEKNESKWQAFVLRSIATSKESRADGSRVVFRGLVEPLVTLLFGAFVCTVGIAMLMPLFSLILALAG